VRSVRLLLVVMYHKIGEHSCFQTLALAPYL